MKPPQWWITWSTSASSRAYLSCIRMIHLVPLVWIGNNCQDNLKSTKCRVPDLTFELLGYQGLNVAMAGVGLKIESEGTYERNTENVEDAYSSIFVGSPQAIVMIGTYAVSNSLSSLEFQIQFNILATRQIRQYGKNSTKHLDCLLDRVFRWRWSLCSRAAWQVLNPLI